MGRVEKDLKLEEWNYNYSKEDFLSLIKRHPFIPFFVDGSSCYLSGNTFRWNSELNVLEEEYFINNELDEGWRKSSIETTVNIEEGFLIDFIVFNYE